MSEFVLRSSWALWTFGCATFDIKIYIALNCGYMVVQRIAPATALIYLPTTRTFGKFSSTVIHQVAVEIKRNCLCVPPFDGTANAYHCQNNYTQTTPNCLSVKHEWLGVTARGRCMPDAVGLVRNVLYNDSMCSVVTRGTAVAVEHAHLRANDLGNKCVRCSLCSYTHYLM